MSLAAVSASSNWGRWSQQQLPHEHHDFGMMDAEAVPTFMSYESRPTSTAAPTQRSLASQYIVAPAYTTAAPMTSVAAPHYQTQNAYTTYATAYQSPPPSTPLGSPFRSVFAERHHSTSTVSEAETDRIRSIRRGSRQISAGRLQSPARSNSVVSIAHSSASSNPTVNSKTITFNETINPKDRVIFDTHVDELMKAIQTTTEEQEKATRHILTPAHTPRSDSSPEGNSPVYSHSHSQSHSQSQPQHAFPETTARKATPRLKNKRWACDGPNCDKTFGQKTHLDIHRRTHSGVRPYHCPQENCNLVFSQRGNLITHIRRHTGEKPFSCKICGKTFAQRGNVRSHEETHKGLKPYICKLDDCNKAFSQLGNMKTHQNNFHKETLRELTATFAKFSQMGEVPHEHREIYEYFREHYKNSNKGIKGRGKARTVAVRKPKMNNTQQQEQQPQPQQQQQQHQLRKEQQHQHQQQQQQQQQQQHSQHSQHQQYSQHQHYTHQPQHSPHQQYEQHQHQQTQHTQHTQNHQISQHTQHHQHHQPAQITQNHQQQHHHAPAPMMPSAHFAQGPMPSPVPAYVPRTYSLFDHGQSHNAATGMLYEDEHARQMAFANRMY